MKGLPLVYAKDIQEDKEPVFDSVENTILCIRSTTDIIKGIILNKENILKALNKGFPNVTDLADYLVKELNMSFREAHQTTGSIVKLADDKLMSLEELDIKDIQNINKDIKENIFEFISTEKSLNSRISFGGATPKKSGRSYRKW